MDIYCFIQVTSFPSFNFFFFFTLSKCNSVLLLFTDMSGKVFVVITLLVALLVSSAASSPVEAKETTMLQQLLDKREKVKDLGGRQDRAPPAFAARVERRAHLSEDEREIMTKQIMQAISGMLGVWVVKFLNCFFDASVR